MRYADLLESAETIYAHVSPGNNLAAILQQGLIPNLGGGNYAGYWESLSGVYVSRLPQVLRQHINARSIGAHYLIVFVQVGGQTIIDEDAVDDILHQAVNAVANRRDISDALDEIDPDDEEGWAELLREVEQEFLRLMGPPNKALLAKNPGFVEEYVRDWITENIHGGETDPMWWPDAKGLMLRLFPKLQHQSPDGSLRIPGKIGYRGRTHITAVVEVTQGVPQVVKGTLSPAARGFLDAMI
jgi:hypothetical protein